MQQSFAADLYVTEYSISSQLQGNIASACQPVYADGHVRMKCNLGTILLVCKNELPIYKNTRIA